MPIRYPLVTTRWIRRGGCRSPEVTHWPVVDDSPPLPLNDNVDEQTVAKNLGKDCLYRSYRDRSRATPHCERSTPEGAPLACDRLEK